MHKQQPSCRIDPAPQSATDLPAPEPQFAAGPTVDIDTDQYQTAKGCLQLSALILLALVVCTVVGVAINAYINGTTGG